MDDGRKSFPRPCPKRGFGIRFAGDIKPFLIGLLQFFQWCGLTPRAQDGLDP